MSINPERVGRLAQQLTGRFMRHTTYALTFALALSGGAAARAQEPHQLLAKDVYKQLIAINTTQASGNTTLAAEAMAARFRAAGVPAADIFVGGAAPHKGNLVVRLRGRGGGQKPLLLLAHLDVVEAKREDWSSDVEPFRLTERDGFYYGRGTTDDKAMAAIFVANLLRLKQQGSVPARDLILALTADEESGPHNGADWLLRNKRELVDAEYGLNEGGGGQIRSGRKISNCVQASEKVYADFTIEVTNKGGHSAEPEKENAIYQLAEALLRIGRYQFPIQLNEITRGYFERMARIESGQLATDCRAVAQVRPAPASLARLVAIPYYNALMRTTCVATLARAGHAPNALPQRASANINCRILPGQDPRAVQRTLEEVVANPRVRFTAEAAPKPSSPSALNPQVMRPIERITQEMWPGVVVVPIMGTGATDSLFFRQHGIPMYGVSGLFEDVEDNRAHGKDERIGIKEFQEGQEFLWRLVNELGGVAME